MNETQALAAAILQGIGPDPDATVHREELARAIGLRCTIEGCTTNHRKAGDCGIHGPNVTHDRIMAGSLKGRETVAERFAQQRADRVEDVGWLIEQRADPTTIAERLGLSPAALAKSLARAGRNDLARPFWRLETNTNTRSTAA